MFEILMILMAISTIRIIMTMRQNRKCLSPNVLNTYLNGRLDKQSKEAESITVHLAYCQKCRDMMQSLLDESVIAPDKHLIGPENPS